MATMHTRRHGKSGSNKPNITKKSELVSMPVKDAEGIIKELRGKDCSYSDIGMILRDSYGLPSVKLLTGKKLGKVISDLGLRPTYPEDLMSLIKKAIGLRKHLEINKHDLHNKKNLMLIESKIKRLVKYYSSNGRIPHDWKYSYERAKLLME